MTAAISSRRRLNVTAYPGGLGVARVSAMAKAGALTVWSCFAQPVSEIRICGNKTCRRQGSLTLLDAARELVPQTLTVTRSGCLGKCGAGPNVVLLPSELLISHCGTVAHLARLLERQLPEEHRSSVALLAAALQLRVMGNAAMERGDAATAVALYTQALEEVKPPRGVHLLLGNRSAAKLRMGDKQGALDDALAAQAAMPAGLETWTRGAEREAEARAALEAAPKLREQE
jgi:hypothetical protein